MPGLNDFEKERSRLISDVMSAETELKHAIERLPEDLRSMVNEGYLEDVLDSETGHLSREYARLDEKGRGCGR